MLEIPSPNARRAPLSALVISAIAQAFLFALAAATILTHMAQLLGIAFRMYAYATALVTAAIVAVVIVATAAKIRQGCEHDGWALAVMLIMAVAGSLLAVSIHRVGRISPDEYYYAPNPVYYTQHPEAPMGFQNRLFHSAEELQSTGFYTAGAYEYAEAAFAFLTNMRFATAYYVVGAAITGALIPLAVFLALYSLSGDAAASTLGALVTVLGITLMGETSWAPGANSFPRAFEGKAVLQFAGVPLLAALSLTFFARPRISTWLPLFALGVGMAGASTTSFALVPLLSVVLCAAYWIAHRSKVIHLGHVVRISAAYFAGLVYLGAWAAFVAWRDGVQTATLLNSPYPATYGAYVLAFIYPPFPLTAFLLAAGCVLAVALSKGEVRTFLAAWIAVALLLALNPVSGQVLIHYFRGIYYRLVYLLPFPLCLGLTAAFLYERHREVLQAHRYRFGVAVAGTALVLALAIPVSIFRLPLYARGNTLYEGEMVRAAAIVSAAPPGVMLAPYPLSGAVSMLDSDLPQMLTRPDLLAFYMQGLGAQADSGLRSEAQLALDGDPSAIDSMGVLLHHHPEIRSVVVPRAIYVHAQAQLGAVLRANGYHETKLAVHDIVLLVK